MGWIILAAVAVLTFIVSGLWWLSGHRGGSMGEPGPIGVTLVVTAIAALALYAIGGIP